MTLVEFMEQEGLSPERRGGRWWLRCPFHNDEAPSLTVSEKDGGQVWHCYGCKKGGGPAHFLAELRGVALYEARREWAALNGEAPPDGDRELLTRIVEGLPGHPFLEARGISEETRVRFRVGYCEDYGELLRQYGVDEQYAVELGLSDGHSSLSGRMVYPFYDREGVYKIASRSVEGKDYWTSPESSKFFKHGLWGMQLLRGPEAWVFEGYHDAMVARQCGYQALAACGTEVRDEGWRELRDAGMERIVFVPDGDAGGRGWLERLALKAPRDLSIEFVVLQSGDPDDALLSGSFQALPRVNPFEWYVTSKWGSPSTLAERCRMLQDASPAFTRLPARDRAEARSWYRGAFGDDESLSYLQVEVKRDVEAERVVLANCLYSTSARLEALQELEEGYFTGELHRRAFTLIREVEATPQLVQVELGVDLSDRADVVNFRRYIERVAAVGRASRVNSVLRSADPSDVGAVVERLYAATDRVLVEDGGALVRGTLDAINERVRNPGMPGVEIRAFPTLNKALLGWRPGKLILVSGNSGHGKTTMAVNFIDEFVDDWPTLMVSLEMSDREIMEKLINVRSGVPSVKLQTGSMEQFEYDEVLRATDSLMHGNFEVVTGVTDLHKIVALAKAHVMRRGVRFVVIDYLQLITVKSDDDRWEQLSYITKTLKNQICQATGATVLALSQLKKSSLSSDVPDAADQAGAYAILAPADGALTVRKVDPKESKDGSNYLVSVSKNRFGYDDVVIPALFDRVTQRIKEL